MNTAQSILSYLILLCLGVVIGLLLSGGSGSGPIVDIQVPTSLEKVEQNYYRNGFSKYLMKDYRGYSTCYNKFTDKFDLMSDSQKEGKVDEGTVTFIYKLGEDGTMLEYKLLANEISDDDLPDCLAKNFKGIAFAPPPLGISRYLTFDFVLKREETYKKELEERKNNQAPQIIPVNPLDDKQKPSNP